MTGAVEYTDYISPKDSPNEFPGYEIKQSDGKAPVLELREMWSTPSMSLTPGPFSLGVVAPEWLLSMG